MSTLHLSYIIILYIYIYIYNKGADVIIIMKMHKLLWNILMSYQKSGVSGVFRNLETVLLQNWHSIALRISVAV